MDKPANGWPADKVERRPVAELIPYARNARTHSAEQVAQLAASIREWSWTIPVLVDDEGGIIAGHGRVLAAQKLRIEDAPCMVAAGWSAFPAHVGMNRSHFGGVARAECVNHASRVRLHD